jgi:hypothetical protein
MDELTHIFHAIRQFPHTVTTALLDKVNIPALWTILCMAILATVIFMIFVKRPGPFFAHLFRQRIRGQVCHECQSTDIYWAGYADRKECGRCGKIL